MATASPERPSILLRIPSVRDYSAPAWFERLPRGVGTAGVIAALLLVSGFIRGHYLGGQLWGDEANTVGIASHALTSIPGILWRGGGAPLYPLLLHVWIGVLGSGEIAVHALSLLFALIAVPVAVWLGRSLFGRRAGYMLGAIVAFNAYFTQFAEEARPYELTALLGLLTAGAFLHVFVRRDGHAWLALLTVALALLAYTDEWSLLLWPGAAVALGPVLVVSDDRRAILRDAAIALGGAAVLYVPWIPTLLHQAGSATAPWHYAPLLGDNFPRQLLGSDRVDAAFAVAVVIGLGPLVARRRRRGGEAVASAALVGLVAGTLVAALVVSLFTPAWVTRYFGPVVPVLLVLLALACARSGVVGLVMVALTCAFLANPASFIPTYKSDMRDVAGELGPKLSAGDEVLVAQPEQTPLAAYYLPAGLRFATALGPDPHPSYMDWDDAQARLQAVQPTAEVARLVGALTPGQHLLFVRPLTEGIVHWSQSWSELVRRRAAQLAQALATDPRLALVPGVFAPHYYRGSCCIASSALLYVRR